MPHREGVVWEMARCPERCSGRGAGLLTKHSPIWPRCSWQSAGRCLGLSRTRSHQPGSTGGPHTRGPPRRPPWIPPHRLPPPAASLPAQRRGRATATLGEISNRADVLLFWGVDPAERYPRLPLALRAGSGGNPRAGRAERGALCYRSASARTAGRQGRRHSRARSRGRDRRAVTYAIRLCWAVPPGNFLRWLAASRRARRPGWPEPAMRCWCTTPSRPPSGATRFGSKAHRADPSPQRADPRRTEQPAGGGNRPARKRC